MNPSSTDRIRASGRVVRVAPAYVYIFSEQYGSVFAYPAAYFDQLPEKSPTTNLTDVLRVDDVVHFVAVPQNGPNDCRWIAIKITKSQTTKPKENSAASKIAQSSSSAPDGLLPEIIRDVPGTIIELHDKNGFIYSDRYGKIYFPMAAAACLTETNELHPLNLLFEAGQWILFDAQRQPCKSDCRYVAVRVRPLDESASSSADYGAQKSPNLEKGKKNGDDEPTSSSSENFYEEGDIARLFPQYGFIRSEKLGTVYFTLAHYESETYIANLAEILSVGDRVRFIPLAQPEKNGCRWRGVNVNKLDLDQIAPLVRMVDESFLLGENHGEQILCEVSVQTDQSLWNTFLATQAAAPTYRRRDHRPAVGTEDAACQTRMPPEALLLKAVKEDEEFKKVLKERFPHLMQFVEKTCN